MTNDPQLNPDPNQAPAPPDWAQPQSLNSGVTPQSGQVSVAPMVNQTQPNAVPKIDPNLVQNNTAVPPIGTPMNMPPAPNFGQNQTFVQPDPNVLSQQPMNVNNGAFPDPATNMPNPVNQDINMNPVMNNTPQPTLQPEMATNPAQSTEMPVDVNQIPPPPPPIGMDPSPEVVPPPDFAQGGSEPPPPSDGGLQPASMKGSGFPIKKVIIIVLIVVLVLSGVALAFSLLSGRNSSGEGGTASNSGGSLNKKNDKEVELTYWGLWETSDVLEEVISDYEDENPGIKITYKQQIQKDYRERLQSELASGKGPDIFRYHNTWLPMLINDLDDAPEGVVNFDDYYPVVEKNIGLKGKAYGMPLMFDTLALYYNPKMMQKAGVSVPTTWEALRSSAKKLRVPEDTTKPIQIAGVALGTVDNVDHFSDILGLLMLQNGANPAKPDVCSKNINPSTKKPDCWGSDAILFYTLFSQVEKVWDDTLPNSIFAFANEKVAMIFAPSWRSFDIKEINPELEFATAPVPQLTNDKINWATYWVEGVSKQSEHQDEAWAFLKYMGQEDTLKKLYNAQSDVRLFGEPYPRTSMAKLLSEDDIVYSFVEQGDEAQYWYLSSKTHDNGINDRIIKYYEDAVTQILDGDRPDKVLPTVSSGVNQVFKTYGISSK